jgi:general secretion pathway protein L
LQRGRLAWLQAPRWRLARWAAVLLAGVNLLGLNAWAWMEQRQLQAAQARLEGLFTSTFAQQPLILSAPVQMAREVRRLELASAAAATADLDVMLGVLSRALPSGRSAQALDYAAGQLQLKGLDMDNADMAALTASLRAQGYSLSAEGATLRMQPLALPPLATRVRP